MTHISELHFDDKNFNRHTSYGMSLIEKSLRNNGAGRSILLDKDNNIIAGNGVVESAGQIGLEKVKIVETTGDEIIAVKRTDISLNSEKGREMALADNATASVDLEWDEDNLKSEFSDEELKEWGVELNWEKEEEIVEDEAPEVNENEPAVSELGKIYKLGEHRLMCGDSTDAGSIELLMDGAKADLVFTDPPYGMSAVSKSGVLSKTYKTDIMNDGDNSVAIKSFELCQEVFPKAKQVWWGANYYTECLPSSECWIVWDKNNGGSDQTDCELAWTNFRSVVRQFTLASEKTNRVHPTQKPVKLIFDIFMKFDDKYQMVNVVDLFGGSGSTMVACEQLGRKCYMMELDPHYCDVIRKRYWMLKTGSEEGWEDGTKAE